MKTRTIYNALREAYRTMMFSITVDAIAHRKARQYVVFERELLRRVDERDAMVAARKTFNDTNDNTMTIYGKWGKP